MKIKLPKIMKDAHIKALSQGLTPEPRVEDYKNLKWYLLHTNESLILGDISCLNQIDGSQIFKSITVNNEKINNVFLPISNTKLLIGTSLNIIPQVEVNIINKATARCSREFFIYSRYSQNINSLVPLIGKESDIVSKEEIKSIVTEIILGYKIGIHN